MSRTLYRINVPERMRRLGNIILVRLRISKRHVWWYYNVGCGMVIKDMPTGVALREACSHNMHTICIW